MHLIINTLLQLVVVALEPLRTVEQPWVRERPSRVLQIPHIASRFFQTVISLHSSGEILGGRVAPFRRRAFLPSTHHGKATVPRPRLSVLPDGTSARADGLSPADRVHVVPDEETRKSFTTPVVNLRLRLRHEVKKGSNGHSRLGRVSCCMTNRHQRSLCSSRNKDAVTRSATTFTERPYWTIPQRQPSFTALTARSAKPFA